MDPRSVRLGPGPVLRPRVLEVLRPAQRAAPVSWGRQSSASSRIECCGPLDHQASIRDLWCSASNSTLMPGDSGSISTSKPGLGVAQSTWTPVEENEIAVVPPTSVKVWVVAAGGAVVGAWLVGVVVVGAGDVEGAVAGSVVDAMGGGAGGVVVSVAGLVDGGAGVEVVERGKLSLREEVVGSGAEGCWRVVVVDGVVSVGSGVGVDGAGTVVSPGPDAARLSAPISVAEGGSTTWSSTTETPAHATPTAAALAANHIENSRNFLTGAVFPIATATRVKPTLNGS